MFQFWAVNGFIFTPSSIAGCLCIVIVVGGEMYTTTQTADREIKLYYIIYIYIHYKYIWNNTNTQLNKMLMLAF